MKLSPLTTPTLYFDTIIMKSKESVPKERSIYMRYLFQEKGVRGRKLLEAFPVYSKATIYRHAKLPINETASLDRRGQNKGRPRKLTDCDERNLVRESRKCRASVGSFSARRLRTAAGIMFHYGPYEGLLNGMNTRICIPVRKDFLTQKDLARRHRFALKIRKLLPHNFWESGISFYLDGTSFVHKTNPFDQARATKSTAWRKRGEGLSLSCTSKGKKAGVEGKTAQFLVSIAYGKGVIACATSILNV